MLKFLCLIDLKFFGKLYVHSINKALDPRFFLANFCIVMNFFRPMQQPYRKLELQKLNLSPYINIIKGSSCHLHDVWLSFVASSHKTSWVLIATSPLITFDLSHIHLLHTQCHHLSLCKHKENHCCPMCKLKNLCCFPLCTIQNLHCHL